MSTTSISYSYGSSSEFFELSSLVERVQDWLKDVYLYADQDMDVEDFETLTLEEEDMIAETLFEALYEDAYFEKLRLEEEDMNAETLVEALFEDAYVDTLEKEKKKKMIYQ